MMKNILVLLLIGMLAIFSEVFGQNQIILDGLDSLSYRLDAQLSIDEPGAAIVINHQNEMIFEKYYGLANISSKEKLRAYHQMGIASMSKQFEGMAVLILVEQGKISLSDDIKLYLTDLPVEDGEISIAQLMSHTSGLPELTQDTFFMNHLDQKRSIEELIELAFTSDFRHEPGERYQYCNTGYSIMVHVIEKLSTMTYAHFLEENIFEPLKMNHTYSCDVDNEATNIAQRYIRDSLGFQEAEEMHFSNLIGGGGIISTAQDINKWNKALLSGQGLPRNYQDLWNPIRLNNGESTHYGLGMGVSDFNGIPFYYHPGMGSGMNAINLIFPEQDLSMVIIRNVSNPQFSSVQIALMAAEYLINDL